MSRFLSWICTLLACVSVVACGDGGGDETPDAFAQVDAAALEMVLTQQPIEGLGVAIYDRSGTRVFQRMYGRFAPDQRVAIASASKLVSGVALLRLVDQGVLSLDSSTGELLGWTGEAGTVTLRHLLSFTSGLQPEQLCTYRADTTLAECVEEIRQNALVAAPGTLFEYGSTHLHVAGRMAEVATGLPWSEVFAAQLRGPLGLPADLAYYANPLQAKGTANPLLAGGLRMSMNEYEPLLRLVFDQGLHQGSRLMQAALFEAQAVMPFPGVQIGRSPAAGTGLRYGLAAWLECSTPATGCSALSSPGAFGFTPWLDRQAGYYAVIGMEVTDRDASTEIANFGVALQQQIKPLIPAALATLAQP
jgi:D-alanyl-D-alanine-carboxypeptidase/D-alanyl-D-alanine-endopeptidase